jgi:hypothetical protein
MHGNVPLSKPFMLGFPELLGRIFIDQSWIQRTVLSVILFKAWDFAQFCCMPLERWRCNSKILSIMSSPSTPADFRIAAPVSSPVRFSNRCSWPH